MSVPASWSLIVVVFLVLYAFSAGITLLLDRCGWAGLFRRKE